MTPIVLNIPDEAVNRLKQRAEDAGYASIEAYLLAFIEDDTIDEPPDAVRASIKRGFEDAFSGRTMSEAEFWRRLRSDDD